LTFGHFYGFTILTFGGFAMGFAQNQNSKPKQTNLSSPKCEAQKKPNKIGKNCLATFSLLCSYLVC